MKKSFVAVSALCVFLFSADATALQMNAGVKGGLGLGTLTGKGVEDIDTAENGLLKPSLALYGLFGIDFVRYFGAQVELGYIGKGKTWADKSNSKNVMSLNFDYLEMPILAKGMLPVGRFKPMVYAGPTFSLMINSTMREHYEETGYPTFDTTVTIPDSARYGFDFGLALGTGFTIDAGPGAIILDIRYTFGFVSIPKLSQAEKDMGEKESDLAMRTGTLAIMVGYQFKFGGHK